MATPQQRHGSRPSGSRSPPRRIVSPNSCSAIREDPPPEEISRAIRGELEHRGTAFGANIFGKLKMVLRSLWSTPSMQDKLPKYIYEPVLMLEEYVRKHNWEKVVGI